MYKHIFSITYVVDRIVLMYTIDRQTDRIFLNKYTLL